MKREHDWQHLVVSLATRSFNSLRVAHEALLVGYPVQALILTRSADEDFLAAAYVYAHPGKAYFWLDQKYRDENHWREIPSFGCMRNALGPPIAEKGREIYGVLSQISRPRPGGLLIQSSARGDVVDYRLGASYDEETALLAYYHLIPIAAQATNYLRAILDGKDPEWEGQVDALKPDVLAWLAAHAPQKPTPEP